MTAFPAHPHHFRVCGVRVRKHHIKLFLATAGAALMTLDAAVAWALANHLPHAVELAFGNGGKTGAAMAGIAVFFDRMFLAAEAVT